MKTMTNDPATWPLKELTRAIGRCQPGSTSHTAYSAELTRRQLVTARIAAAIGAASAFVSICGAVASWLFHAY